MENSKVNKDLILREKLALQRTVLANQTTFLSFLRTSMYFLVAGLSIRNLLNIEGHLWLEIIFYSVSATILVLGILNFFIQKKIIKKSNIHVGNFRDEYLNND